MRSAMLGLALFSAAARILLSRWPEQLAAAIEVGVDHQRRCALYSTAALSTPAGQRGDG